MTKTNAEIDARIAERIVWTNDALDILGPVTAENLVRPFRQWMHRLSEIGHIANDLAFLAPLDEGLRVRTEQLVNELSRAADLVTSIAMCDVRSSACEVAAAQARGLFEVTTDVANLRTELSYQVLADLET